MLADKSTNRRGFGSTQVKRWLCALISLATGFSLVACKDEGGTSSPESTKPPPILYVDDSATGAGNGLSWKDAYTSLSKAAGIQVSGQQIWVGEGSYRPSSSQRIPVLVMRAGVEVYGGFAGTETALDQRPVPPLPTVLSGDYFGDDGTKTPPPMGDNSKHVVVGASNARLDGFIVKSGFAYGSYVGDDLGGGMTIQKVSGLVVANVVFEANWSTYHGGGVYIGESHNGPSAVVMINVDVNNNVGYGTVNGAGMYIWGSSVVVRGGTFSGNTTTGNGGGLFVSGSNLTLASVTFRGNSADRGGGMFATMGSPILTNVAFHDNNAIIGGAMHNESYSTPILTNVSFLGNSASNSGGALANNNFSNTVLNNIAFFGNTDQFGISDSVDTINSQTTVNYSCTEQAFTGTGNVILTTNPFQPAVTGELFLDQLSTCVDGGSEVAANDVTYGFTSVGLPHWSKMTTDSAGALDTDDVTANDVDRGCHYHP